METLQQEVAIRPSPPPHFKRILPRIYFRLAAIGLRFAESGSHPLFNLVLGIEADHWGRILVSLPAVAACGPVWPSPSQTPILGPRNPLEGHSMHRSYCHNWQLFKPPNLVNHARQAETERHNPNRAAFFSKEERSIIVCSHNRQLHQWPRRPTLSRYHGVTR